MEWIYGRQVVRLAALEGARRRPKRVVGTAAALCAAEDCTTRELPYRDLRGALAAAGVYFES